MMLLTMMVALLQETNGWRLEQLSAEMYDVNLPVKVMHAWRAVAVRL